MRVAVVGGRLQGIEATYLCLKAGYETVLLDRDPNAPAKTLADEFHNIDIVKNIEQAKRALNTVDAVLPANENRSTLTCLEKLCNELEIPFMQDNEAFWITSDKLKSFEFFLKSNIPTPAPWPSCGFPVIVKPSSKSGSENVYRANDTNQLKKALKRVMKIDANFVVQEFIDGLALSLEVIGKDGLVEPLQITALEFDEEYGCKRVYAPVETSIEIEEQFNEIGTTIASELKLNGLTDIQALVKNLSPSVNEINARLPSQTPSVVYHSTNINMAELLVKLFVEDKLERVELHPNCAVVYQHVKLFKNELRVQGEHVMANASGLQLKRVFFGADEAITNLASDESPTNPVATLIVRAPDLTDARRKMNEVVERIMTEFELKQFSDSSPKEEGLFDPADDE